MAKDIQISLDEERDCVVKSGICNVTGESYEVSVPRSQYQAWQSGKLIQRAMPQLTNEQREFFITGITGPEWSRAFNGYEAEQVLSR